VGVGVPVALTVNVTELPAFAPLLTGGTVIVGVAMPKVVAKKNQKLSLKLGIQRAGFILVVL
jgi:hypothetical protein